MRKKGEKLYNCLQPQAHFSFGIFKRKTRSEIMTVQSFFHQYAKHYEEKRNFRMFLSKNFPLDFNQIQGSAPGMITNAIT